MDKFEGTIPEQLETIHKMDRLELNTQGKAIVYRFKKNSSQKGRDTCKLYNMNFFHEHPTYYQSGLGSG